MRCVYKNFRTFGCIEGPEKGEDIDSIYTEEVIIEDPKPTTIYHDTNEYDED